MTFIYCEKYRCKMTAEACEAQRRRDTLRCKGCAGPRPLDEGPAIPAVEAAPAAAPVKAEPGKTKPAAVEKPRASAVAKKKSEPKEANMAEKVCSACGQPSSNGKLARGLCHRCYQSWHRKNRTKEAREAGVGDSRRTSYFRLTLDERAEAILEKVKARAEAERRDVDQQIWVELEKAVGL
jgi:hypothetical protein